MTTHYEYATKSVDDALAQTESRLAGISAEESLARRPKYGRNVIQTRSINALTILMRQVTGNTLIIVLTAATALSFAMGDRMSSIYIMWMIVLSIGLGFWNEYSAERTVEKLLQKISPTTTVLRDDARVEIPVADVTVGDIVLLSQGSIVPADMRLIGVSDLQMNQSALTGESKTSFKVCNELSEAPHSISDCANIVFTGTSVDSGSGRGVVIGIGSMTEYGKIAQTSVFTKPQTDFEKGLSGFSNLLVKTIISLTIGIFVINFLLGRDLLSSVMFALAIAVGLTPELLPVIVTVSLAHGAGKLAKKKVIAKQLVAIENLGNMDILCTDKTGTLTQGSIELVEYKNARSEKDNEVLSLSLIANSAIVNHHIIGNGIDSALWKYALKENIHPDPSLRKVDDEPFDFNRKAMFSVVEKNGTHAVIMKGAPDYILSRCSGVSEGEWHRTFAALNSDGLRGVAVARMAIPGKDSYTWEDMPETGMEFVGYLTFLDTPKMSAKDALAHLKHLGVSVKIVTGDNELVTQKVCKEVGMEVTGVVLSSEIDAMTDEEFKEKVMSANIFARVTPDQKMRIITTLRSLGHSVGYMGDGINDIPSLRAADVGISVNTAVDVAKDAASVVLLSKGLDVISDGIHEGRHTFSNTIKYILMGTASNFGNMFSAAGASFLLPFLPMRPVQILLTNALYDLSQLSITTDNVDAESVVKPRHWDIASIRRYMLFFGPASSLFDFMTFGVMIFIIHANYGVDIFAKSVDKTSDLFMHVTSLFQTGWFVESVMTEILVVFIIRTARSPLKSMPSKWLLGTSLSVVGIALVLPFTGIGESLGFVPLPPLYFAILVAMVGAYLVLVEFMKQHFLQKIHA